MQRQYQLALQRAPLKTKAVTSAFVAMLGEVIGHVLKQKTLRGLSPRQMLAFFAFGGAFTGPVLHYWYTFLEKQRLTKEKLTPNKKLLADRLVFTPPFVAFTIFSLGVLRGSSVEASRSNLRKVYPNALVMNWKVWTVTQWLSFHYVPPHLRVFAVHRPPGPAPPHAVQTHDGSMQPLSRTPGVNDADAMPSLTALCLERLATVPPNRTHMLLTILRILPEELVMELLHAMIAQNTLTDDRLAAFFMFPRRVLTLYGCSSIRNSILRQIPFRCPELVNNTVVRAVLQGCTNLHTLKLDGCRHITDAAFQPDHSPFYPLRACTSLQVVSFARCSQLTKELLSFLAKACRSLTDINLSRCKRIPSDAIHAFLCSAPNLQRLNLSFTDIGDEAFVANTADEPGAFHAMARSLRVLDLTHCNVTDATLHAIAAQCHKLEELRLSNCSEITDIGVEALTASCRTLRKLDLNNCGLVTDRGIRAVAAHAQRLESLNLSWCMNITDKGLVALAQNCEGLAELRLVWCTQLTDAAVDCFVHLGRSTKFYLSGCKGISGASVEAARLAAQTPAASTGTRIARL
ncbi:TPA: hypothetical protein N0F65_006433 [Lagenidium giganteum]|uniref:F-box/LRR-repeat protein 15-like leucin rich repeat domain-containing protein n=1 Tax=Lagenidium giganteum TaxID=4803 RepID=A0AAV2Z4Q9_9STRA|nr:TPA: hypothetical protein N0F65_006433 [Lagenidium giganteum]